MPSTTTRRRPDERVTVSMPAGAARFAADVLAARARAEDGDDRTLAVALGQAAGALHAAGWEDTTEALDRALDRLDARDVGLTAEATLPVGFAVALLVARGWRIVRDGDVREYVKPGCRSHAEGGRNTSDYVWSIDNALALALAAEALAVQR